MPSQRNGKRTGPKPEKEFLVLKCHLDVTPANAFRAWTDPTELGRWWGPDDGDKNLVIDLDPTKGGRYHIATRAPNGDQYDFNGEFREVIPNETISFTWDTGSEKKGSTVTAELRSDADGTELTLTHEGLGNASERDGCRRGWQGALRKLERLLSG
jgi:uncharacterized protein YndB with AHSA1/START domain